MWNQRVITGRGSSSNVLVVVVLAAVVITAAAVDEITDFIAVNMLPDGEIETRIYYRGVSAQETTVGERSNNNSGGMKFRQLATGHNFIQLIYDESTLLRDCEYMHQSKQVETFLSNFKRDLRTLLTTSNVTIEPLDDGRPLPSDIADWFDFSRLKKQCRKRHKELKADIERVRTATGNGHHNDRHKRDLSSLLRMPGTKWCGKGYSADKYTRLGGFSRTDKCCRRHDTACPFWIGGFDTKYGLFNWRVNTIMHCSCDERFRACLKMVDSSDANLVGKLFFNVVQTKCFVLKPRKKCVRGSWWGKCEKYRFVKRAILRDNIAY